MNDIQKVVDSINSLAKNGLPIKTDNTFKFDAGQLIYMIGGLIFSAIVLGFAISAGQKVFNK